MRLLTLPPLLLLACTCLAAEKTAEVVPERDPAPEKPVELVAAVAGKHPRILFTEADIPRLKKLAEGDGKAFFDQLNGYVPACVAPKDAKYITDATDAQRQGFWRLPTVALHYVLTGEKKSLDHATAYLRAFLAQEHWETGGETDCGMGAANILTGAAIAYDWLYHDLPADLREACGKRLLLQARRMYYGGHLGKASRIQYWQNDPQNNHRWHRDAGLALAVLAVAGEPNLDTGWLLEKTKTELQYLHDWLPEDGTSHESASYLVFGAPYIVLAFDAADRCLGTDLLGHPWFKTVPVFRLHMTLPGFKDSMQYGDSGGNGFINNFAYRCTGRFKDADAQAGLLAFSKGDPSAFQYGWFSLLWFDPEVKGGSLEKIPTRAYYPDIGLASFRDSWSAEAAAMIFKCSPPGGLKLNEYRNKNNFHYINVGHDDPDANMFEIYCNGGFAADNDRYAGDGRRLTSSHNTILVDGKGQKTEAKGWNQPLKAPNQDMTKLCHVTAYAQDGKVAACEGEAANSYTGLTRFRRTAVWVEGAYVLILDDIVAEKESALTWLVESVAVEKTGEGQYRLGKAPAGCAFHLAASEPLEEKLGVSTALAHGDKKPMGLQQLQATAKAKRVRIAAVFDVWNKGAKAILNASGETATVSVQTEAGKDEWTWAPPAGEKTPSKISARRADGSTFELK
ncbi:MAG: heparinase II/III family protein [Planctomycetota bacterium]|nr:heparinase II/III family protein [Planctomycetota bacterium]